MPVRSIADEPTYSGKPVIHNLANMRWQWLKNGDSTDGPSESIQTLNDESWTKAEKKLKASRTIKLADYSF